MAGKRQGASCASMPVKQYLHAILLLCLLSPSANAQSPAPTATPDGAPGATPSTSGAAPGSAQPNAAQPNGTQPGAMPPAPSSPGSGTTTPGPGAGTGAGGGTAPVSPAVPFLASPLPAVGPAFVPPPTGNTLPAAPPDSLAPVTPGATGLTLTADDAARLAARKNLGLFAALKDVLAAQDGVRSARALSPPSFTIGPALEMGGTTDGLLFLQPLEINGVRGARTHVAQAQLRLTQAQALIQLQSLVYTSRFLCDELARAQAQLALQQSLLVTAQQFDQIARQQVALGARPGIEQTQTAIEVARARQLVAQAQGEEEAARAALNAYLGRAPLDPVVAATSPPSTPAAPPDIAAAQAQALRGRAEVAAALASRDIPAAQASLYRAQGRPDLSPDFRISQITPTYMDAGFGVVLTIPIDYGTRRGLVAEQDQSAQAQGDRLVGTEAQVRLDAAQAAARLQAAQSVLAEYDAGLIADAQKVLDAALYGFRSGATSIIAVLDAQRTYRQIVSEQVNAQASVAEAGAALDRATGTVPPSLLAELRQDLGVQPVNGMLELK